MVEGARLLSVYTGNPVSRVRIPLSPFPCSRPDARTRGLAVSSPGGARPRILPQALAPLHDSSDTRDFRILFAKIPMTAGLCGSPCHRTTWWPEWSEIFRDAKARRTAGG